jgi:hypothetical protein
MLLPCTSELLGQRVAGQRIGEGDVRFEWATVREEQTEIGVLLAEIDARLQMIGHRQTPFQDMNGFPAGQCRGPGRRFPHRHPEYLDQGRADHGPGLVPKRIQGISGEQTRWEANLAQNLRPQHELSLLANLDQWDAERLEEEGIIGIQGMAQAEIAHLVTWTPFPTIQVIDWVDQAILLLAAGAEPETSYVKTFRKMGPRGARGRQAQDTGHGAQETGGAGSPARCYPADSGWGGSRDSRHPCQKGSGGPEKGRGGRCVGGRSRGGG